MEGKVFLPDYGSQRVGRQYRGLYRLFDGEEWHHVLVGGLPTLFPSQAEAVSAAKDAVRAVLNPPITSHRSADRAFIEAAASWFANKHENRAREQIARKRGVRDVVFVEVKGKRHANKT